MLFIQGRRSHGGLHSVLRRANRLALTVEEEGAVEIKVLEVGPGEVANGVGIGVDGRGDSWAEGDSEGVEYRAVDVLLREGRNGADLGLPLGRELGEGGGDERGGAGSIEARDGDDRLVHVD